MHSMRAERKRGQITHICVMATGHSGATLCTCMQVAGAGLQPGMQRLKLHSGMSKTQIAMA